MNGKIVLNEDSQIKFNKRYKIYVSKQNQVDLFNKKKLVSYKDIQRKIKENEVVLSYNVNDQQGKFIPFIFVISKENIQVVAFNDVSNIVEQEMVLDNLLQKLNQNTISKYEELAFDYYKKYFKPIETLLSKKVTHIRIISSVSFGNIPFEVLLSSQSKSNNFSKLPYLLNKYQFSYDLSSSISKLMDNKTQNSTGISVFSPSFSTKNLSELKESRNNAKAITDLYNLDLFQGKKATKKTFSEHLENDKMIALLSHGKATLDEIEANKGIYLSDGFLNLNDVYKLNSNCDFLLLGACESGVGYKSKEGNINLARAFTSIGVKSMMLASWKIDEKSSSQIITSFLKYLDNGCTKSEALQKAKLDYLATASPRMANPLYWAGLNITGNNETIVLHKTNYWWLGLVLIWLGVMLFIILRYIKKRKE